MPKEEGSIRWMNPFKLAFMCLIVSAASIPAAAQSGQSGKAPAVADITAWISIHLQPVSTSWKAYDQVSGISKECTNTNSYQVRFDGCSAMLKYSLHSECFGKPRDYTATGTFDLKDLRPEKVSSTFEKPGGGSWAVILAFARPITFQSTATGPKDDTSTILYVADEQMATRMAHAWHDAILACGGKEVPDNLY